MKQYKCRASHYPEAKPGCIGPEFKCIWMNQHIGPHRDRKGREWGKKVKT